MKNIFLALTAFALLPLAAKGQNWDLKVVKIPNGFANIVYAPKLDRIFACGDQVVYIINPYYGFIEDSIPTIKNMHFITLSDDAQYLYATSYQDINVYRYRVSTKQKDLEIPAGKNADLYMQVAVMPGKPTTVAISRGGQGGTDDVAIYDNNIRRARTTSPNFTNVTIPNIVFSGADSTKLYGYNNWTSGNELFEMKIDAQGISVAGNSYGLINNTDNTIQYSPDGYLYSTDGVQINIKDQPVAYKEGVYRTLNVFSVNYFIADPVKAKAYGIVRSPDSIVIFTYNKQTFNIENVSDLPFPIDYGNYKGQLIQWGAGKLAMLSANGYINILRNDCAPSLLVAPTIVDGAKKAVCYDSTVTLTASGGSGRYIWSTGDTGKTVFIKNTGRQIAFATVAAINAKGCVSPYSAKTALIFDPLPSLPQVYKTDHSASDCLGDSVRLTVNAPLQSTALWSTGALDGNIWVKQSGYYSATTISANGCKSLPSAAFEVNFQNHSLPPSPAIQVDGGGATICSGDTVVFSAPTGYAQYQWSTGAKLRTIKITPTAAPPITVRVMDVFGCQSPASEAANFNLTDRPYAPYILKNGATLASSFPGLNQWFLNGAPIKNATGQFYKPAVSGAYTVESNNMGCFSAPSNTVQF